MKQGWEIKKLGDILQKTETINPLRFPEAEFEYIDVSSVSNTTFQIEGTQRLKGKDAPSRARRVVRTNDVLFATVRPTLRRITIVPGHLDKQVCSTGYFVLRPKVGFDHRFVFYWLFSEDFMGQMEQLQKGASYPAVTDGEVRAQLIPIPPLPEQQRIVAILDQAFEAIATAKANAEKNLKNARALFESHLQAVFTQRGNGWVEKPLSRYALSVSTGPFGSLLHKSDYVSSGVPLVNPINIINGVIVPDGGKMINQATIRRLQNYVLQSGDVVIGRRGEIGRCAVVSEDQAGWVCGTGCFFIRPLPTVNSNFLAHLLRSSSYREKLELASTGATMLNLSNKALGELLVSIPDLQEQEYILGQLDAFQEETQRLESIYQRKLAAFDELKKSLLLQAFSGEL